jgi:hypothetical protein
VAAGCERLCWLRLHDVVHRLSCLREASVTQHNAFRSEAEHESQRARPYRYARTEGNITSIGLRKRVRLFPVPVRSYSPPSRGSERRHIRVLRKQIVQPPADRAQPLYPTVRLAPALLDRSHLRFRHLSRQVQLPPVTEVDASPGHPQIVSQASMP